MLLQQFRHLSARFGVATIFKPFSGAAAANLTLLWEELPLAPEGSQGDTLDLKVQTVTEDFLRGTELQDGKQNLFETQLNLEPENFLFIWSFIICQHF